MTSAYHSARIPAGRVVLEADITIPQPARGMVLFAHGSGSSRFSPRNRYVAQQLQQAELATVLADLLTPASQSVSCPSLAASRPMSNRISPVRASVCSSAGVSRSARTVASSAC